MKVLVASVLVEVLVASVLVELLVALIFHPSAASVDGKLPEALLHQNMIIYNIHTF